MLGRVEAIVAERCTDVIECYVNPSGTVGSHVSKFHNFYQPESLMIITLSVDSRWVAHEPTQIVFQQYNSISIIRPVQDYTFLFSLHNI